MNRKQFDKSERRLVSKGNFLDALWQILPSDQPDAPKTENREPTSKEANRRWGLARRGGKPVG